MSQPRTSHQSQQGQRQKSQEEDRWEATRSAGSIKADEDFLRHVSSGREAREPFHRTWPVSRGSASLNSQSDPRCRR